VAANAVGFEEGLNVASEVDLADLSR